MRIEGTLKSWNDDRGFGFIEPSLGGQEIFVHVTAFANRAQRPRVGQRLTFEIETSADGRKRAKRVRPDRALRIAARRRYDTPAQWGGASYFAIPAFLLAYLVVALLWRVPHWLAAWYFAASVACFIMYAIDKSAATSGRSRVSERTLLSLGLVGGWPGAIVAQQLLRHKSNKASFRSTFWTTVLLNVLGFLALGSPLFSP